MKRGLFTSFGSLLLVSAFAQSSFTSGNLVVLQTAGTTSKAASQVVLKEFSTAGIAGISDTIPSTGVTPFQGAGVFGGSEGFLTTSTDNKYLVVAGYHTAATSGDITATSALSVPRAVGTISPSGFYLETDTSTTFYSANDIRGAISDGTNFWASGAANASVDGIDYFGPGTPAALGVGANPPKAYGLRIFNGQIYYSTQKAGPSNTSSQLGIFSLGSGLPTSGTTGVTQIINTGTTIPQDFSFNAAGNVCYIAVSLNTALGGIQKWTKTGSTWTLAYTIGTGVSNIGAYGLVVDYGGANPIIYATTFEAAGNRIIKVVDGGTSGTAVVTTLVPATGGVCYKGITFAPVASGTPVVNISISTDTASESGATVVTVKANASFAVTGSQTVSLAVSGNGITAGDYSLSNATITIPNGSTSGSATFTIVDDTLGEGPETAFLTISNPSAGLVLGTRTAQKVTIADNDGNNPPHITLKVATTSDYIDGGASTSPASPFAFSSVINDPTDAGSSAGIDFTISDTETADTSLVLTARSSNTSVVPNANILLSGAAATRNVKITPAAVGYSNITLTVKDGTDSTIYVINYAASAASTTPATTIYHTGFSDASAAYAIDNNNMVIVDDEKNVLNVYDRTHSGLPVAAFAFGGLLALTDSSGGAPREVDLEGMAPSLTVPGRLYTIGSMSNQSGSPFNDRPNRNRIFAVTRTGTGSATSFSLVGYYSSLRGDLINWGATNNLGLAASAAAGQDPKNSSGFNIEGMAFAPDNTTLYLGFRAPLLPTTNRINALIAPVRNFETWFNNGAPAGSPVIDTPILMDLAGRGIRELFRQDTNTILIIAGDVGSGSLVSQLYKWNGNRADAPVLLSGFNLSGLNPEGLLNVYSGSTLQLNQLQLISDEGDIVYYADGTAAKDLLTPSFKKFRSDYVTSPGQPLPIHYQWFNAALSSTHSVALSWAYNQAEEIARFEVERSTDGAAFSKVATITSGNEATYTYDDLIDGTTDALYYRIKAIAQSGSAYYTNIRQVKIRVADGLRLFPNPASGAWLNIAGDGVEGQRYQITNIAGKRVTAGTIGANGLVDISSLNAGYYYLEIIGTVVKSTHFIRQ